MVPATLDANEIKKEPTSIRFVNGDKYMKFQDDGELEFKANIKSDAIKVSLLSRKRGYPLESNNNFSQNAKEKYIPERKTSGANLSRAKIEEQLLSRSVTNQLQTNSTAKFTSSSSINNSRVRGYRTDNNRHFAISKLLPSTSANENRVTSSTTKNNKILELNPFLYPQTYFSQTNFSSLIYNYWAAASMRNCLLYKSSTAATSTPFAFPYFPTILSDHGTSELAKRKLLLSTSFPWLQGEIGYREEQPYPFPVKDLSIEPHRFAMSELIETKPKRVRTTFNTKQLSELEKAFAKNHYLIGVERESLAKLLKLSQTQIKVWFQNRRTKHKNENKFDEK